MTRTTVIAGNWKMYKTIEEASSFVRGLATQGSSVYLAVPFTAIRAAAQAAEGSQIVVGAQNMHDVSEGAFTGEIACQMLLEAGARFVILGHSERRHIFGETDAFINRKVQRALTDGLQPILCVGETLQERESGKTQSVLQRQIEEGLAGIDDVKDLIVAYEPVWAIGTGKTASPDQAEEAHAFIRGILPRQDISILYGGSVKPGNAKALLGQPNVDGALVGGASLEEETLLAIESAATVPQPVATNEDTE